MKRTPLFLTALTLLLVTALEFSQSLHGQGHWRDITIAPGGGGGSAPTNTVVATGTPSIGDTLVSADVSGTNGVWARTVWTNLPPVTDMEGGTVYVAETVSPLGNGFLQYAVNALPSFWGGQSGVLLLGPAYANVPSADHYATNNATIVLIGDQSGFGDDPPSIDQSGLIFGFGSAPFGKATLSNAFAIYGVGDNEVFSSATIRDS